MLLLSATKQKETDPAQGQGARTCTFWDLVPPPRGRFSKRNSSKSIQGGSDAWGWSPPNGSGGGHCGPKGPASSRRFHPALAPYFRSRPPHPSPRSWHRRSAAKGRLWDQGGRASPGEPGSGQKPEQAPGGGGQSQKSQPYREVSLKRREVYRGQPPRITIQQFLTNLNAPLHITQKFYL